MMSVCRSVPKKHAVRRCQVLGDVSVIQTPMFILVLEGTSLTFKFYLCVTRLGVNTVQRVVYR